MSNRTSRAVVIMRRVLREGAFDLDTLAQALVLAPADLARLLEGGARLPMDRQLCLALLLREQQDRSLARLGRELHAQVIATAQYHSRETTTHSDAPAAFVRHPRRARPEAQA